MAYYEELLIGRKPSEIEVNHTLDFVGSNQIQQPYLENSKIEIEIKDSNDITKKAVTKTLEEFTKDIHKEAEQRFIYFISYNDGILCIKRNSGLGYYEMHKYRLTQRAAQNVKLVNTLTSLGEDCLNYYERTLAEEKYAPILASIVYEDKDFLITDLNELIKFQSFYERFKYRLVEGVLEKIKSKNIFNKIQLPIIAGLIFSVLLTIPLDGPAFLLALFIELGLLTTTAIACGINSFLESAKAKKVVESHVSATIDQSQKALQFASLSNSKNVSKLDSSKKQELQDTFIEDIKQAIKRINKYPYKGSEEHKKLLYKLAELYVKAKEKNVGGTPYNLFMENGSLMDTLVTIEKSIDTAIAENYQSQTSEEILAEIAALTGMSPEELLKEEPIPKVEEHSEVQTVQSNSGVAMLLKK